jgi:hypothetical protein
LNTSGASLLEKMLENAAGRQRMGFGNTVATDSVDNDQLAYLIVKLQEDVFAKIG